MNRSAGPRRARWRWLPVALAVAALHLLLLWSWQQVPITPASRPSAARPPLLVWLRPAPPPAPAEVVDTPPPARAPAPRRRAQPQPAAEAQTPPVQAATAAASVSAPAAEVAAPTAAASAPAGRLLDSEASRRAIREAARQRSTAEMAAEASGSDAPLSTQERLGQEIARGARGDCLKGDYAGAGMGLFSLPFWLIAELRDKCRR